MNEKGLANIVVSEIFKGEPLEQVEESYSIYIKFTELKGKYKDNKLLEIVNTCYTAYQVKKAKENGQR